MAKEFEQSRRCAPCDIDWPIGAQYATCPLCGGQTEYGILPPLAYDEALTLVNETKDRREREAHAERRMDEAFDAMFAQQAGIDLSTTAPER